MVKLEAVGSSVTTILLVACGAIGVGVGISDIFGLEHHFIEKKPYAILISLVGLIALSLGVERAIDQRKLSTQLDRLEERLASRGGGRMLNGLPEIELAAKGSVTAAGNDYG